MSGSQILVIDSLGDAPYELFRESGARLDVMSLETLAKLTSDNEVWKVLPFRSVASSNAALVERKPDGCPDLALTGRCTQDRRFVQSDYEPMKATTDEGAAFEVFRRHRQSG